MAKEFSLTIFGRKRSHNMPNCSKSQFFKTSEENHLSSKPGFILHWPLRSDTTGRLHFHFHALEKEMATHSNILAWRIPWTEEPGGLQSMGSQRVGHDWATKTIKVLNLSPKVYAVFILLNFGLFWNPCVNVYCVCVCMHINTHSVVSYSWWPPLL